MKQAKLFLNLICVVSLLATTGCFALLLGAAAGAGGVVYVKGTLEKNVDAPVVEVHQAALDAIKGMGLLITNDDITRHDAKVIAQFDDQEKVTVTIKALTEKAATLKVRVGILGNETRSVTVLNAIEDEL